jgi:Mg-chelatase subunit ChlD
MKNLTIHALVLSLLTALACSGDPADAVFGPGDGTSSGTSGNGDAGCGFGGCGSSGGEINGCAGIEADGKAPPVHMVLMQDISGSMCGDLRGNGTDCSLPNTRWQLTLGALSSFFKNAESKGISVSVIPWSGNQCSNVFDSPTSPSDVPLPDATDAIVTSMRTLKPNGVTPTKAAIEGAVRYASKLKASLTDGGRVVIALSTDGEPTVCGTSADAKAAAALANQAGYPVYVIGIGESLVSLDSLAEGGGTNGGKAFIIKNDIAAEMSAALRDIKGASLGCSIKLPTPADGGTVDLKQVNVKLTVKGTSKLLTQSQNCSNPDGWKYAPNEVTPSGIELCANACASVTANLADSKLKVVVGCATVAK